MCTGSAPKPKKVEEVEPQYLRNPWLDGLAIGKENSGRSSLRIDPAGSGGGKALYANTVKMHPTAGQPAAAQGLGIFNGGWGNHAMNYRGGGGGFATSKNPGLRLINKF